MPKIYKPGKVAIVLSGRYAGKKVVIVKQYDDGSSTHAYPHAIVAGVERGPLKITKSMGVKKVQKRSKIKPFIKRINYTHLMPTRYTLELENVKSVLSAETFKEPTQRETAKKEIKKMFEEKHSQGKNKWFFSSLKF